MKKENLIHSVWSFHGDVFYKEKVDSVAGALVTHEDQLREVLPDFFANEEDSESDRQV